MNRPLGVVPRWAQGTCLALSLIGLGISVYLTITHFDHHLMVCSTSATFNCELVTSSPQSYFLGIPVAILGLADYVVLSALNTPWAWRSAWYPLHVARFAIVIGSMGFVLWLVSAELLIIDHICLWCTGVHIVTFALLVVMTRVAPAQLGWTASGESRTAARAH